jgi:polyhydroxyalkanoate synthesis regulator phasin
MPATKSSPGGSRAASRAKVSPDNVASFAEQFVNRIIRPFDMVLLTRERIQETLDEAAERGRVTRSDANELVAELVRRGRQQTDDIASLLRGGADRALRAVGSGGSLPILGYDELTARQVTEHLKNLKPAELRKVRDYERRHANRKSVLAAVDKALA